MIRVLRPGGRALVTVWAKEQKLNNKDSFYISKKSTKAFSDESTHVKETSVEPSAAAERQVEENKDTNIHNFGKEFKKSDLFVSWRYNPKTGKNDKQAGHKKRETSESSVGSKPNGDIVSSQVFLRYYHIFENNELERLFEFTPQARIVESFYEQGNWCVIFEKV
jgi:alkylated DNA repair protein alkB family protein 8